MKIYVVGSSKDNFLPLDNIREKFLVDIKHTDNNIDHLNPWYCELTGLFHLWQNCKDDIVGLEHYRRYFVDENNKILSEDKIKELLTDTDVICRKYTFEDSLMLPKALKWWVESGNYSWLNYFVSILPKDLHDFYSDKLKNVDSFCQCNMFICKKEIIDKYCYFMFNLLKHIPFGLIKIRPRIVGYIAEYFFGFWLEFNGYKIKYNNVIAYDKTLTNVIENF